MHFQSFLYFCLLVLLLLVDELLLFLFHEFSDPLFFQNWPTSHALMSLSSSFFLSLGCCRLLATISCHEDSASKVLTSDLLLFGNFLFVLCLH